MAENQLYEITLVVEPPPQINVVMAGEDTRVVEVGMQGPPGPNRVLTAVDVSPDSLEDGALLIYNKTTQKLHLTNYVFDQEKITELLNPIPRIRPEEEITDESLNKAAVTVEERFKVVAELLLSIFRPAAG